MAAGITDTLSRVTDSTTGRPVIATLANPGKAIGASSININDATNWTTQSAIHFSIFNTVVVAGITIKDTTSQTDWKGVLAGTVITNLTLTGGTDREYTTGALVEITPTARYAKDLYDNITTHANQDGTLKTSAVQAALNIPTTSNPDWTPLATIPSLVSSNGQREFLIRYSGVDYTDRLQEGTKLKIPRTVTPGTQSTLLNGTNQYWNRTATNNGFTFTDDFACGAWVYLTSYPSASGVVISKHNGTSGFVLHVNASGQIELYGTNGGAGNYVYVRSYQAIPLNEWVYISPQLDMSSFTATTTTCYLMIDGVNVPVSIARAGTNPTAIIQAGNLEIGSYNGGTNTFPGYIKNAWVSSAKVPQANIQQFMNADLTPAVCTANNIISAYNFNGNANDVNTTNANNLTANNGATATSTVVNFKLNEFAFATKVVYSGGNTDITIFCPQGTGIPNETLGVASYSTTGSPFGFPMSPLKWDIRIISNTQQSAILTSGVTAWLGNWKISVPTGSWKLGYHALIQCNSGSGAATARFSLSTSQSSITDERFNSKVEGAVAAGTMSSASSAAYVNIPTDTTSSTDFFFVTRTFIANQTAYLRGDEGANELVAECAYL